MSEPTIQLAYASPMPRRKWRERRRAKRAARRLRNKEGVGPAHIKGVSRAEERGLKHPHKDNGHAAGRLMGSIHPR